MKLPLLFTTLAIATLAVGGCHREEDDPASQARADAATGQPASDAASRMPQAAPHAAPAPGPRVVQPSVERHPLNPRTVRNVPPFDATGIPACDNYAQVVRQCINVHTYGTQRGHLRGDFADAVEGWKKSLDAGTDGATVAQQCTAFRDSFRAKLQAVGCTGV